MNTGLNTLIKPQFRTVDGVRIRYADRGGSHETTLLLTSPWPESIYAFGPMWATLAEHARLFAVDLPGFGASERREAPAEYASIILDSTTSDVDRTPGSSRATSHR